MTIERYTTIEQLRNAPVFPVFSAFLERDQRAHFFQSPEFLELIQPVAGFRPVLLIARDEQSTVVGSLLGFYQSDGGGLKSWLSRRLIVNGGPLGEAAAADALVRALLNDAAGKAIYAEFRNFFDMAHIDPVFARHDFVFRPHLNFLLDLEGEEATMKKLSGTRRREIRGSLAQGATYGEAASVEEVSGFYELLSALYRDKVGKPVPAFALFERLHASPSGRVFVVRYQGRVIGGSAGPVYKGREIYHWYVCGDNSMHGVHASVLATWAQIAYAAQNGYTRLDFMGAGKPGQGYGVHDFKARFGGTEVGYGRYEKVLNRSLYRLGVLGLKVAHRLTGLKGGKR